MLRVRQIGQPSQGQVLSVLREAIRDDRYDSISAPVAYAVDSGTTMLLSKFRAQDAQRLRKRWLVAIDWCRSSPVALDLLGAQPKSEVRIVDGPSVVSRPGCPPLRSFHPKGFLFTGKTARLLIAGSANLSRNGLTVGTELDSIIEVSNPRTTAEWNVWRSIGLTSSWFNRLWQPAAPYADIRTPYENRYKAALRRPIPVADDTTAPSIGSRSMFKADDLVKLRAASHFWIQTKGGISKNRGPGSPGNQLMMSAFSRVFFGSAPTDVPRDTHLGYVTIAFSGHDIGGRSLRFSNNAMDVLTLPVPGTVGPPTYDNETLLFTRIRNGAGVKFVLDVLTGPQAALAKGKSSAIGAAYSMTSGRECGVY